MHNMKLSLLAVFLLCLMSVIPAVSAADEEESLWGYADPTADVNIYINTKQAEKAMSKDLWERIKKDKDAAIAKKSKGQFFSTKDRDMELMGNLRIISMEPFCGTIDGVANISGDMMGDIDKMMESLKQTNGVSPELSKQNDMDFYTLALSGADGISGLDCMVVPVKPNQIQFRFNINSKDPIQKTLMGISSSEPSPSLKKLSSQDLAFAIILSPEKIAGINFANTDSGEKIAEFLKQLDEIAISVYVAGSQVMIGGSFAFKSETSASEFVTLAQPVLSEVKSFAGGETPPRINANGKDISITIPVSISDAWDAVSRITQGSAELDEGKDDDWKKNVPPEALKKVKADKE